MTAWQKLKFDQLSDLWETISCLPDELSLHAPVSCCSRMLMHVDSTLFLIICVRPRLQYSFHLCYSSFPSIFYYSLLSLLPSFTPYNFVFPLSDLGSHSHRATFIFIHYTWSFVITSTHAHAHAQILHLQKSWPHPPPNAYLFIYLIRDHNHNDHNRNLGMKVSRGKWHCVPYSFLLAFMAPNHPNKNGAGSTYLNTLCILGTLCIILSSYPDLCLQMYYPHQLDRFAKQILKYIQYFSLLFIHVFFSIFYSSIYVLFLEFRQTDYRSHCSHWSPQSSRYKINDPLEVDAKIFR
jgi:hypothetical protein